MSEKQKTIKIEHEVFEIALLLKMVNAVLELVGGVIIFFVPPTAWQKLILLSTQHELSTDPTDFVANYLRDFAANLTIKGEHFLGIFLASHGVIKLFLIYSLLKKKLWSYPLSVAVFSGFIVYQMYEFSKSFHYSFLLLSILDLAVVILTLVEYNNLRKASSSGASSFEK